MWWHYTLILDIHNEYATKAAQHAAPSLQWMNDKKTLKSGMIACCICIEVTVDPEGKS